MPQELAQSGGPYEAGSADHNNKDGQLMTPTRSRDTDDMMKLFSSFSLWDFPNRQSS